MGLARGHKCVYYRSRAPSTSAQAANSCILSQSSQRTPSSAISACMACGARVGITIPAAATPMRQTMVPTNDEAVGSGQRVPGVTPASPPTCLPPSSSHLSMLLAPSQPASSPGAMMLPHGLQAGLVSGQSGGSGPAATVGNVAAILRAEAGAAAPHLVHSFVPAVLARRAFVAQSRGE